MRTTISLQGYCWCQIYERTNQVHFDHLDEVLGKTREAGFDGFETGLPKPEVAAGLRELLPKYGLSLPTMYVGGRMHEENWPQAVEAAVARIRMGRELGARVAVVNPDPIQWGKPFDKNDEQLSRQAEALERLGELSSREGVQLAYHTHDAEMRNAARELHHMMQSTDPKNVGFCLDAHWIYRGAGNSQLALWDILKMYGDRVKELHVRQSRNGVWTETLGDGDIDYSRLARWLKENKVNVPIVLEQCFEAGTPSTLDSLSRFRADVNWAREMFQ